MQQKRGKGRSWVTNTKKKGKKSHLNARMDKNTTARTRHDKTRLDKRRKTRTKVTFDSKV